MPKKKEKAVEVTVVPYEKVEMDRIYCNFVAVKHTPFDFTIEFCEISPISEKDIEKEAVAKAEIKVKLALPTKLIPSLISALTDNYQKYEEAYEKNEKK